MCISKEEWNAKSGKKLSSTKKKMKWEGSESERQSNFYFGVLLLKYFSLSDKRIKTRKKETFCFGFFYYIQNTFLQCSFEYIFSVEITAKKGVGGRGKKGSKRKICEWR